VLQKLILQSARYPRATCLSQLPPI